MGFGLDSITGAVKGAADWVGDRLDEGMAAAGEALDDAATLAGEGLASAKDGLQHVNDRVDSAKAQAGDWIEGAVDTGERAIDGFRKDLVEFGEEHGGVAGKALAQQVSNGIGIVEGASLALHDMGKGVVQLVDGAGKLVSPLEWATHGGDNLRRLDAVGQSVGAIGNLANPAAWILDAGSNVETAKNLWNGVTEGYQEAAANGDWSKFIGRGVVDVGSLFIGVGEANAAIKGAQGAGALSRIGEGANALDKAADATRALDAAGDGGRIARADDALRAADDAVATQAARAADDLDAILARADTGTTLGGRRLLRFDSADDFNIAANAAQPNTVYAFGNYRYTTDAESRVIRAEGKVELAPAGRNDPTLQTGIGNEGRETDVGFHLVADRFGGQTNRLNVVPGNGKPIGDGLPNHNNGAYKRFENEMARLREAGHDVEVRISPEYTAGNTSTRPDSFIAEYRTDGGRWIEHEFPNK